MKTILFIIIMAGTLGATQAQLSLERQVVSSTGETLTGGQLNLDITIGEAVVETISQGTLTLTQGFQQGVLKGAVNIDGLGDATLSYQVYPNPTKDKVNIVLAHPTPIELKLSVVDQTGRSVLKDQVLNLNSTQRTTSLDVSTLANGVYYVVLVEEKSGQKVSFKVDKL